MKFWWVNHKQTREHEVRGGYLWSPFRNANGAFNQTYENMRLVQPGDVVFSFAYGQIGAIGHVMESASPSPKPSEFGDVGDYWSNEGWLVGVDFRPAPTPFLPSRHAEEIAHLLPHKYSPIQANGHGNQGCYLASISDALGLLLMERLGVESFAPLAIADSEPNAEILVDLDAIQHEASIAETMRVQLTRARVGQGLFRANVLKLDPHCKVTGIDDKRLLVASHIKPWRHSTNNERLSGFNGLALSPHVDALFDQCLLSFEDEGRMLVHPSLPLDVLNRWSIDPDKRVDAFQPQQRPYLAYHRQLFAHKAG